MLLFVYDVDHKSGWVRSRQPTKQTHTFTYVYVRIELLVIACHRPRPVHGSIFVDTEGSLYFISNLWF